MDPKSTTKIALAALISEFSTLQRSGMSRGQSEATARTWIERFLQVFGWNPSEPAQVKQEYRIQGRAARRLKAEGTTHLRPDYCLLSHGQRTLFIDAKKFDADLKEDSSISFQIRCYGWSEGFKVSYAFDFEELAIYDCRIPPRDRDEADIARVHYIHYSEYLDHFDLLWDFFSKEAIDSGSLSRQLPDDEKPKGSKSLDEDFEERLSGWRKDLAKTILRYGKTRDAALISAAAQRILDRIIFLRICEEFGFEELGTLLEMATNEDGFWPLFLEQHETRYIHVYDGILFPAKDEDDPSGVDAHLRSWWLKGRVFRDIVLTLYYPNPYRFDAIPIELLGGVYERYLGKRLRVIGSSVEDEYKPEYQRTKGAVYTPPWIVARIVKKTLDPICSGKDPEALLQTCILDPACGSAGFLLGVFDYLELQIVAWFNNHKRDERRAAFIVDSDDGGRVSPSIAQSIINQCIYGVDIDPEAVEVARMSLALRYLERMSAFTGEPHLLLSGIGKNIRQGNSIVGTDIIGLGMDADKIIHETMPFDWHNTTSGFGAVMARGGFDAIVGNPPYIEVKRYKEWMPLQYQYLKESGVYETTAQGKTDIAMPFMEQGLRLLKKNGRLGFIIQNRFFKTDYGEAVRSWLIRNKAVAEIEDFRDIQIFAGRTTYTAIMILQRNRSDFGYVTYENYDNANARKPSVDCRISWDYVDSNVWAFDQPDLLEVHGELLKKHGTLANRKDIQISVGLQTLYGKLYQFEPVDVKPRTVIGRNGDGEEIVLERAALRPLCRNRGFYPFRIDNADAWVIFPYDIKNGEAHEIAWTDFKLRYHKTADYLEQRKKKIVKAVDVEKGPHRWHLYTYPKNLVSQSSPKVLFPSTIEDAIATVDPTGDVYLDNVRVNSISVENGSTIQLQSIACLINSTVFNALVKLKAGLSDSGWRQINRQFMELAPFPSAVIDDPKTTKLLAGLADRISELQSKAIAAKTEGAKSGYRSTLESLWNQVDETVESAYGLTKKQKEVIHKYPRRINRYDLLTRQAAVPENDEE
ncbi:MAG: N-6 DNA methylase [Ignavibacteriales bacterium]|nr:N-6 DNA methylase [Ignavibacteriales bacterium]